jgi:threonine synthase
VSDPASTVVCAGCGAVAPPLDPYPFRCANAGQGDVDHVMTVILDPAQVRFPKASEANPFCRYRTLFHAYHLGRAGGLTDADYLDVVTRLDAAVAGVDGRGFTVTPFARSDALSERLGYAGAGGVWIKDETGNVSGSHKARHLMGLLIHLEIVDRVGLGGGRPPATTPLAIASCGNAALAAAVVARAGARPLHVFIPPSADPRVVARLHVLGARLTVCPRQEGVVGDPTYHRLQQAIRDGALPFTCQGPDNGLTIEGGKTLGYEIASDLWASGRRLDRLFVQVGGGALASAVFQGLRDAIRLGAPVTMPRIHAVQSAGGYPLKRAYDRIVQRLGEDRSPEAIESVLRYAATHRSEFMWPWEDEPRSVAHGILDDETYDWLAVVRGMLSTGGYPVVADEATLMEANDLAIAATGISVDHTGSAGLAGLLHLHRAGEIGADESVAVLFTGTRR